MAKWNEKKDLDMTLINNGKRYENNDPVKAEDINNMYEAMNCLFNAFKNIHTSAQGSDIANVTSSWNNSTGRLTLYFEIPKGDKGDTPTIGTNGNWFISGVDTNKPSRGEKGETGDKGATFSLSDGILTITSN
nr:MAG TPA: hypothetical protein [Caudoviricetes sp.]